MYFKKTGSGSGGFTLVELLVTIVVISILASVGLVTYNNAQRSARVSKRIQDLKAFQTALELFKNSTGGYPIRSGSFTCVSGLNELVPNYMPTIPEDPLGASVCYQYQSNGTAGASLVKATEYKLRTNSSSALTCATCDLTQTDIDLQAGMKDNGTCGGKCWAVWNGNTAATW